MSQKAEDGDQRGVAGPESGLEALRQSPEFRGPGEPPDDHDHANDHFALLYDRNEEQLASAIPFIRQGLERGEQCLYVADDNSKETILEAMRAHDIDVDAALESGALSILTPADTYRRTGEFARETMLEFWEDSLEEAKDEDGYTGLRAAAEMTWALEGDTDPDELAEYEAVLNSLYEDKDYVVMCQYNRERFPVEVIHDVIKTHPHLVVDNTVSQNFYYTPPEKFFGPEDLESKVDRMTQTLREHTTAKTELQEHREFLQELYEVTASNSLSFEEKLQAMLDLGCEQFDMDLGGIAIADPTTDRFEVEATNGNHENLDPGQQYPLSETYCQAAVDSEETCAITAPESDRFEGKLCYDKFGVRSYLGTYLEFDDAANRTFWFVSNEPRADGFSESERTFHHLMGQWVQYELERQQREQELRERTEHLNALIETTPECIKTVAPDGTLLQMNSAGLDMVEADAESDVVGDCVYDLIAPEHRERFREFNERICSGERETLEFDIIGLEGTRRHMESHAAPLRHPDGTITHVAITRDITEQIERERELERALDLLEKTERIADVGGWEINVDTRDVFWTDHIFDLLEVDADEEPPLEEALDMYHEEDQPIVKGAVEDALDSGDSFDVEVRIHTDNGDVRWLRLQGVPETVDDEVVSLRGAAHDITEHKEREHQLEELVDRLEASNHRLKQFAYAASHDLQEPLRMVSSYLQLLENQYRDDLNEEAQEYIDFAVDGADRMRAMVNDLLAFSRVEQADGEFEPVDCNKLLDRVTDDLQVKIKENDAEISVKSLPTVQADSEQLEQVFSNLVSNAIKYSGDEPPEVEIAVEERTDQWEFLVADNGIGIDPDKTDRIFEVFKRLHHDREYPGTGIGLSLCQEVIENHGGDIWVESEPGEGSTFFFTIPKQAAD
ncbi:MEDS domain-containing protein [Haloterrigena sp. SYSU A121-1]|uniref:histidine kinase n=1 Tax=Haloterrigena gelatinilytica TaxID=2741724 RepID=A0A8J8KBB8_9EURY|nr:MEDS domain-containing protein [Haloterrigena gelatinilytica]NUB91150.1 MEDS domain-containing protein [Haloterrigena gelatinilytica]